MLWHVQVCKAGLARVRKIWLSRHGESLYNTQGKLGGNSALSPKGEIYARLLPDTIIDRIPLVSRVTVQIIWGDSDFLCRRFLITAWGILQHEVPCRLAQSGCIGLCILDMAYHQ